VAVLSKPGCVDEERIGPGGRVAEAGDAVYGPFERTSPSGRILVADVVAKERVEPGSCVVVSGHVFIERTLAVGRVVTPWLAPSAPGPVAVLLLPVWLLRSAPWPMAVLKKPVVLLESAPSPKTLSLAKVSTASQANSPRVADSSSRKAVNFSSACTTKRFLSPRRASAIQIAFTLG